ncbi:MAG TPA: NUDIX hydrolase [Solirubrobacteraceae bacterium]|nr:NUDIX hydrolase [Solirubrobacteraceae bacterium]
MEPPRVTSSRVVYENRWMRLREDRTESRDGTPGLYAWIEKPPSAVVVALDGADVWLVEQFRHPVGRRFWEFPQGAWEDAPDAPAEELARGELAEETGLRAAAMERLGTLFFAYGMSDQRFDVWLATGLEPGPRAPEATEHDLVCAKVPVARFEAMIAAGEVADAATVAAWHLVSRR